jgi:hypothetical protein
MRNSVFSCVPFRCLVLGISILLGCSRPASTVDDRPFREAIGQYLQANNMAMRIKEIKQGPVIDGENATLQASMTHEKLGGPSVTWDFRFAKSSNGSWEVTRHEH